MWPDSIRRLLFTVRPQVMNENTASSDVEIGKTAPIPIGSTFAGGAPLSQWLVLNSPYGPSGEVQVEARLGTAGAGPGGKNGAVSLL